jgi:hypothetical protein
LAERHRCGDDQPGKDALQHGEVPSVPSSSLHHRAGKVSTVALGAPGEDRTPGLRVRGATRLPGRGTHLFSDHINGKLNPFRQVGLTDAPQFGRQVAGVANVHKHRPRVVACYLYAEFGNSGVLSAPTVVMEHPASP